MNVLRSITLSLILVLYTHAATAATPIHKCVVNGGVTFQRDPCPSEPSARYPSKDELIAERKKRVAATSAQAASASIPARTSGQTQNLDSGKSEVIRAPSRDPGFRCDGRQYCSQMRSCEEATWFIRNCPNTKMDGEGDGIPCEQQHCN